MAHLDPADPAERRLRADQAVMTARNVLAASPGVLFIALILGAGALIWTDLLTVALWLTAMLGALAWTVVAARRIRAAAGSADRVLVKAPWFIAAISLRATCLASIPMVMWVDGSADNHIILIAVLVSSAAVNTVVTAPFRPALISTAIYCLGGVALCATQGGAYLIGIPLFLALGFMMKGLSDNVFGIAAAMLKLRQSETELIDKLHAANRTKSEFLANMSHELRTPLNAVIGFSDVMRQQLLGPVGSKTYLSYAEDIHVSGNHLLTLINQILDLSKLEAGKVELNESEFCLREVVDDAQRIIALRAEDGGVTLVNEVPRETILRADVTALRQVALNVAMNAVKFTAPGGHVSATTALLPDGRYCVKVTDTGCGIRAEDIERVFEPFGQGRHDIAAKENGTGLGLPIVRSLMRAHGGDAFIESTLGEGTTVFLTLPTERVVKFSGRLMIAA
ncbi:Sensor histidine kinase RcsC [Alphaproteobacteria bacterium SO-S41]|nr:Sensor histidine kinase RcsC [Alphaproteobacteria bacterium SO-S41]